MKVFWLALSVATMAVGDVARFDLLVFLSIGCLCLAATIFSVWATQASKGACCRERNMEMLLEKMVERQEKTDAALLQLTAISGTEEGVEAGGRGGWIGAPSPAEMAAEEAGVGAEAEDELL